MAAAVMGQLPHGMLGMSTQPHPHSEDVHSVTLVYT